MSTRARLGLGTPQGNPTVEPEFRRLLPADVDYYTTRLRSNSGDARTRLVEYIEHLPDALASFGPLELDAFGFACTGSSYLVGHARETELASIAGTQADTEVITATAAIRARLAQMRATRIALVSPYPPWLTEACVEYWNSSGIEIASVTAIELNSSDTLGIYAMGDDVAWRVVMEMARQQVDAILLTGTGLPTLDAIARYHSAFHAAPPLLSSNLCLAQNMLGLDKRGAGMLVRTLRLS